MARTPVNMCLRISDVRRQAGFLLKENNNFFADDPNIVGDGTFTEEVWLHAFNKVIIDLARFYNFTYKSEPLKLAYEADNEMYKFVERSSDYIALPVDCMDAMRVSYTNRGRTKFLLKTTGYNSDFTNGFFALGKPEMWCVKNINKIGLYPVPIPYYFSAVGFTIYYLAYPAKVKTLKPIPYSETKSHTVYEIEGYNPSLHDFNFFYNNFDRNVESIDGSVFTSSDYKPMSNVNVSNMFYEKLQCEIPYRIQQFLYLKITSELLKQTNDPDNIKLSQFYDSEFTQKVGNYE